MCKWWAPCSWPTRPVHQCPLMHGYGGYDRGPMEQRLRDAGLPDRRRHGADHARSAPAPAARPWASTDRARPAVVMMRAMQQPHRTRRQRGRQRRCASRAGARGEVRVRVQRGSSTASTWYMRDSGAGITHTLPQVMGADGAGVVDEDDDEPLKPGDRVVPLASPVAA